MIQMGSNHSRNIGMKDPERLSNLRKFTDNYDWSGLKFPVAIKSIKDFEMNNDISINVLSVENKDIYICRKGIRSNRKVNSLLISEGGIWHYTAIKSLSRLLTSRNTKHKCKQHFCNNCLQSFTLESSRDEHEVYCEDNEAVRVEIPGKGSKIEFCDGQDQFKVPFIMYTDFEPIPEPIQDPNPAPTGSYKSEGTKHSPSGCCVYSKFAYGEVKDPLKLYRGKDCLEKFCDYIRQEAHRLYHMFPEKPMDPLTLKQWKKYNKASRCHICFKQIGDSKKGPKVRDHCHYTGRYRGPAHRNCNLMYRIPSYIPVVFHNLSGYDAHLFIRELGRYSRDTMKVIAKNKEDYISLSVEVAVDKYVDKLGNEKEKLIEFRFIDSFKLMASSLDSLTRNLVGGGHKMFGFENCSEQQYELLTRKRVYPYEHMTS